jgi:hypothetical protein
MWKIINEELNTFRSLTYVKVQNGAATSFWFDHWHPSRPFFSTYSALFSHTARPDISVQYIFQHDFDLRLRPRLTTAASQELRSLLDSLQDIDLVDRHDIRLLKSIGKPYNTRAAYVALDGAGDEGDHHGRLIWKTQVPAKVKIFAWLYFKDRLSTRSALANKHILDDRTYVRCRAAEETRHHIFFSCPGSRSIWVQLGLEFVFTDSYDNIDNIWTPVHPAGLDVELWPFVFLTILWRIWDARNGHIFREETFCSHAVLAKARDDLLIWKKRLHEHHVNSFMFWHVRVSTSVSNSVIRHV